MDLAEWKAGNKYRYRCLECDRWLPCCSEDDWAEHESPHVLPADDDPDDPELVPAEETDYEDDLINRFVCPRSECSAEHTGHPPECDACGIEYQW